MGSLEINNIPAERHLVIFNKNAVCDRYLNHKFKAAFVGNNMILYDSLNKIMKVLNTEKKNCVLMKKGNHLRRF